MEKICILHHNDRDGYMSAAIVINHLGSKDYDFYTYAIDHTKKFDELSSDIIDAIDTAKKVYLLDYSISNIENLRFIGKRNLNNKWVWIDHHKSSADFMTSLAKQHMKDDVDTSVQLIFNGLWNDKLSGAMLTWLHLYPKNTIDLIGLIEDDDWSEEEIIQENGIPRLVWYTSRYDTWDIDESVINFNFGYTATDLDAMVSYLNKLDEYYVNSDIWHSVDKAYLNDAITKGKAIKEYEINFWENFISQYGVPFTLRYKGKAYKALMVNMPFASSLKFGKYADEYEVLMPFYYNGTGYTYSLYKTKLAPEELDVSELACSCFDGGGHKNAAGFTLHNRELQVRPHKHSIYTIDE